LIREFGGVFEETSMEPYAGDKFIHVIFKKLSVESFERWRQDA